MMETARAVSDLKLDGIKIHPLHIIKGTKLEDMHKEGDCRLLRFNNYLEVLADFLGYLSPEIIIQRVGAYCQPELLVAPWWILERNNVEKELENFLELKNYYQGRFLDEKCFVGSGDRKAR